MTLHGDQVAYSQKAWQSRKRAQPGTLWNVYANADQPYQLLVGWQPLSEQLSAARRYSSDKCSPFGLLLKILLGINVPTMCGKAKRRPPCVCKQGRNGCRHGGPV